MADQRDTTIAISATEIQALLDGFTHTNAIFLGGLLCGLYLLLAILHLALLPSTLAKILVPLAAATALLFYVMRWVLKTKPATIIFANYFATFVTALIFINCILHLYLTKEPKQTTNLMMLLIGAGFSHLHTRWYRWNIVFILLGWVAVVSALGLSPDNIHFSSGCIIATTLSIFIHRSRVKSLGQTERLRLQGEYHRRRLEEALSETEQACLQAETSQRQLLEALQTVQKTKDELEQRVKERTLDLERSNRELQDFASIASHDLQEPLRKVQAFGSRLKTKYAASIDDDGRDYFDRMLSAASRMQTLINDLLTLSWITTKALPFEAVDLAKIMAEVIADLEIRIEQTNGRIETDNLPVLKSDPIQMRQLLQNLVGNALKFHKPDETPVVKIKGEFQPGIFRLEISDNGIGFDEKYSEQIFAIFQRLHGRGDYEGTGVGLAVCRKIAERHGGTIMAKSQPGQGAIFIISLPCKEDVASSTAA